MKLKVIFLSLNLLIGARAQEANNRDETPINVQDYEYSKNYEENPSEPRSIVEIPDVQYTAKPQYNYAEALAMSMLFYEAQRSGKLPENHRVDWRGDSGLFDGLQDDNIDLVGGYYDGASYIKYGYTMAFTTTVLSWGVIRYRRAYEILGQLDHVLDTIKWATDYFIKCHPSKYVLYGQVSDKASDSQYFGRPEDMDYRRKSFKITAEKPGSDLAAETSAAMAAASIVFYSTDKEYSEELLYHARQLYDFATIHPGKYSDSIPDANQAYASSEFRDDVAWAAVWMYKRTAEFSYLGEAEGLYKTVGMATLATEFSWSSKQAGVQILLAETTRKKKYRRAAQMFCEYSQPESSNKFRTKAKYTPKGLLYINSWGSLRYAANSAFMCTLVADLNINSTVNRVFAAKQINYMLGSSGRSFVVGFGENPPTHPFHKSSYCPDPPERCLSFDSKTSNTHILHGALVGGPAGDDSFKDERMDEKQNSVTIDFNAGFQSALAGLLDFYIFGPDARPHVDRPGVITVDEATLPPPTVPTTPKPVIGTDWQAVLRKSLMFYEAQRSGRLDSTNQIPWRGDSALKDGFGEYDLAGGYYDGYGYEKYGFPLCFSMTMLSWSLIEYEDAFRNAGLYDEALDTLRWGMNYILKTHIHESEGDNTTLNYIVGQVGEFSVEAQYWDRPEKMNYTRDVNVISPDHPGTDLAGEMSASLAAASIVFRNAQDSHFSALLYNHSAFIFRTFVRRRPQQSYINTIPQAAIEYPSSGFRDELAWAAAWLYQNRKHRFYYRVAMQVYSSDTPTDFSWDNKTAGVQLLMGKVNRKSDHIGAFCDWLVDSAPRTEKGLLYLDRRYPAKYAANAAFILMLAYEKFPEHPNSRSWLNLGYEQIQYLLGSTGRSYMIGHGSNQPTQPYHKASSCPVEPPCGFYYRENDAPNPQKLIGALVGGPDIFDQFEDKRLNKEQSRVSLDGNAGFQAAVAAIYHLKINNKLGNSATNAASSFDTLVLFGLFALLSIIKLSG